MRTSVTRAYVVCINGRNEAASLCAALAEDGMPPERLVALHAPARLAMGALRQKLFALSILA